jgi:nucleoside 2-deoxyribosyltransferase
MILFMKKAYLSIGFQNRQQLLPETELMRDVLAASQISLFIFVDNYQFPPNEEKQMMQQAFREIDASDLLIAETSEKAIGVGIEIGYAVAMKKPVIYLRKNDAEHSTTAAGSAGYTLIYDNQEDLGKKLSNLLLNLKL